MTHFPRWERGVLVNSTVKTIMFWIFILICLMLLFGVWQKSATMGKPMDIGYSDLLDKIDAGQVQNATIQGTDVHGQLKGQKDPFHTTILSLIHISFGIYGLSGLGSIDNEISDALGVPRKPDINSRR